MWFLFRFVLLLVVYCLFNSFEGSDFASGCLVGLLLGLFELYLRCALALVCLIVLFTVWLVWSLFIYCGYLVWLVRLC